MQEEIKQDCADGACAIPTGFPNPERAEAARVMFAALCKEDESHD